MNSASITTINLDVEGLDEPRMEGGMKTARQLAETYNMHVSSIKRRVAGIPFEVRLVNRNYVRFFDEKAFHEHLMSTLSKFHSYNF